MKERGKMNLQNDINYTRIMGQKTKEYKENMNFTKLFALDSIDYSERVILNYLLKNELSLRDIIIGLLATGKINDYRYGAWEINKFLNMDNDVMTGFNKVITIRDNYLSKYQDLLNDREKLMELIKDNHRKSKFDINSIPKNMLSTIEYQINNYLQFNILKGLNLSNNCNFACTELKKYQNNNNNTILNIKELFIIFLNKGIINKKNYSNEDIANFLNSDIKDVDIILKNVKDKNKIKSRQLVR